MSYRLDVYFPGEDPLISWGLERTKDIIYKDIKVKCAPVEYVIIQKLIYFREGGSEKHLRDIKSVVSLSENLIDDIELTSWIRKLNLETYWDRV